MCTKPRTFVGKLAEPGETVAKDFFKWARFAGQATGEGFQGKQGFQWKQSLGGCLKTKAGIEQSKADNMFFARNSRSGAVFRISN